MNTIDSPRRLDRLHSFVTAMGKLLDEAPDEHRTLSEGAKLLVKLVSHDDWLPAAYAQPNPDRYQQFLLHCDSLARFSVVSFVWGPGQLTPIHDHTVWGLVGMMRGSEIAQSFTRKDGVLSAQGSPVHLHPGDIDALSPLAGDIHQVSNALADQPSISIHVYGADIGAVHRSVFAPDGTIMPFVSGYSNDQLPNIWGVHLR